MDEPHKGNLLVISSWLIFGLLGVLTKTISSSSLLLLFAMQIIGALSFLLVLLRSKKFSCKGSIKLVIIMSIVVVLNDFFFLSALKLVSIADAVFIKYTSPIFIVILVPFLIKEKWENRNAYAAALAFLGLFLILYQGVLAVSNNLLGMVFAILSAIFVALYLIFIKKIVASLDVYTTLFYRYLIGAIIIAPFILNEVNSINLNTGIQLAIFGLLFTIVATSINVEGLKRIKVQRAGILGYLDPLSATAYGIILLSEIPTVFTIAGGALILLSTYLVLRK